MSEEELLELLDKHITSSCEWEIQEHDEENGGIIILFIPRSFASLITPNKEVRTEPVKFKGTKLSSKSFTFISSNTSMRLDLIRLSLFLL